MSDTSAALPVWAWLLGFLGVAAIGALPPILGLRRNRREALERFEGLADDHGQVSSALGDILRHVLHLDRKIDGVEGKLDEGLARNDEAHAKLYEVLETKEDRYTGPERRAGGDRRHHDAPYQGPDRRSGTDRRDAELRDL